MKKFLSLLSVFMLIFVLAACGSKDNTTEKKEEGKTDTPKTEEKESGGEITILQNKPEIDAQLKAFAKKFEQEKGIKVNVKSCGGDACQIGTQLKADFTAGQAPDVFVIDGKAGYDEWKDYIMDLGDQPWVSDTDVAFKVDGKTYGFPVTIEGWGMAFNADMLAKAGIDPATLNNYAAYEAAFKKLDSMKKELGIDSVVSMAAGAGMEWVVADHNLNSYLSNGLAYTDGSVKDKAVAGELDATRFAEYAKWVGLLFKYADKNVLLTGNYDSQVGAFANQKAAFVHQGNWIEPNLKTANATFKRGFAPHGSMSTPTDGVFVSAPSWYVINKESKVIDQAKEFLTYLATSEAGQNYIAKEIGAIPAFKSVKVKPDAPLSASIMDWSAAGKIYAWNQYYLSSDFRTKTLGPIYGLFAKGEINEQQFIDQVTKAFATLKK